MIEDNNLSILARLRSSQPLFISLFTFWYPTLILNNILENNSYKYSNIQNINSILGDLKNFPIFIQETHCQGREIEKKLPHCYVYVFYTHYIISNIHTMFKNKCTFTLSSVCIEIL